MNMNNKSGLRTVTIHLIFTSKDTEEEEENTSVVNEKLWHSIGNPRGFKTHAVDKFISINLQSAVCCKKCISESSFVRHNLDHGN